MSVPLVVLRLSLQVSQYLEGYLWPFFDPATASDAHVMSILVMVNEKFREGVPAWTGFHSRKVCCGWRMFAACLLHAWLPSHSWMQRVSVEVCARAVSASGAGGSRSHVNP
jgi:hypothetical protein